MAEMGRGEVKRILFNLSVPHAVQELVPVAELFLSKQWEVTLLFGFNGQYARETADCFAAKGMEIRHVPDDLSYGDPHAGGHQRHDASKAAEKVSLLKSVRESVGVVRRSIDFMSRCKKFAARTIESLAPDVVVSNNFQSCGRVDDALAYWCRHRQIPFYCILVSPLIGKCLTVGARVNNLRVGMLPPALRVDYNKLNRLIARIFPEWTYASEDVAIFMFSPYQMLAARLEGLLPADIWQVPSFLFDRVFVPAELTIELLEESGYPMDKVVLSGPPRLDKVMRQLGDAGFRHDVFSHVRLPEGTPFVLWNVEPSWEHHYASEEDHWRNFKAIAEILRAADVRIVLSLHPLCDYEHYKFIEDGQFTISRRHRIEELYPFCSLAVSFPCSTNIYSHYFDKRLIVYDWYEMRTKSYLFEKRFLFNNASLAENPESLKRLIEKELQNMKPTGEKAADQKRMPDPASEKIFRQIMHDLPHSKKGEPAAA